MPTPVALVPRKPMSRAPATPPTRCTPTTSSASSYPNLYLMRTASEQSAPAMKPSAIEPIGLTKPAAGVMATRPATAPDAAPSVVGFPSRNFSTTIQPSIAAAVAVLVLTNAYAARLFAPSAEPALNPNQPNHNRPAPSNVNGKLGGRIGSFFHPSRFPRASATARPAAPAFAWTTVPPAKSSAPFWNNHPSGENTQCAIGA